ncbi:hypothetical protein EOD41_02690 [Mucilaginibacter limnophilus]|uniref:Uncharacterized protein n=1 Tax=Mucilaginibacter limnophilus TaxID=1932778 RepID=A0A437MYV9_9SPHI|nr:hypothetical protein [Mucilaginibacter limnophilus]RVU02862.1 hypothetical protein EOD41_02690 [Mucilaginibacter limnophilus]
MLNRLLSIFLLVALISSNFSRLFIYAGFEANRSYIAKELCVNKARPTLHCNGRCYLMKKLKQADEKEKKQEREEKRNQYQEALPVTSATQLVVTSPSSQKKYAVMPAPGLLQQPTSIFQPPKVV